GPTHGTLVGFDATTGAVMYVPNPNYNGVDSFTFTVCDPSGACDTGTIAVTVSPVNDAPVAEEQDVWTREDVELPIRLSGSDVDGEAVSYAISITPQHGTLVGFDAATGAVTYIPGPDFAGMDSFVFTVCDGQLACAQATITIEVAAVNDPPNVPDVLWTTNEDTPTGFLALEIVDPDQSLDELVYSVLELPLHGTLEWGPSGTAQYTPDPDFFGTDSVSYQVCDAAGACDGARITVLVLAQNDAPSANGASLTVSATDPNPITLTASDPDGDVLVYRLLSQPDHGSILDFDDATGVLTYVAAAAYEGGDAFSFEVCDASGACDTAIVELRVVATAHAPVAEPQAVSTFEDTPLEIVLRATDVDGDSLTYSILGAPAHGRIEALDATTGALVYVPGRGFDGEDVFTFEACDSTGACAVSFVTVSVLPVNNPPSVVSLETTVTAGVAVEIALVARDPDEDPVTFTILQPPTHGSVVRFDPESGVLVYLPDEGYAGPDVVAFAACDPWGACADGVVQTFAVLTTGGGGAVGGCDRRVVISEVAWAGTAAGAADEWIELRNLEDAEVDLTGWTMRWRPLAPASALDGFWRAIGLTGIVGAFSGTSAATVTPVGGGWHRVDVHAEPTADIALLERGADNVVADVRAIQVYVDTVALGRRLDLPDGGAVMELVDPYGCLVDRVDPSAELRQGWPAGNAEPSASMQRSEALAETPDAGWSTNWGPFTSGDDRAGHPILGTPGRVNPPAIGDILALLPVEGAREIPMGATLIVVLPDEPGAWTSGSTIVRLTDRQTGTLAIPVSELLAEVRSVGGVTTLVVGTMDLPSGEYALWVRGAFNAVYATLVAIKP
ncbi:MAG: Ig-like domain-containing protein, partial [Candidatus Bipolaricaulis sp.]|nr:Ig-like domain-containing protein [Candidatus Bipolaricaulis sp.]